MDFVDIDEGILLLLASRELQEGQGDQCIYTGQLGQDYIQELLGSSYPERVFQVLRIRLPIFYSLRDWLLNIQI